MKISELRDIIDKTIAKYGDIPVVKADVGEGNNTLNVYITPCELFKRRKQWVISRYDEENFGTTKGVATKIVLLIE